MSSKDTGSTLSMDDCTKDGKIESRRSHVRTEGVGNAVGHVRRDERIYVAALA